MRTAIVYDFDGTLSPGNMQDQTILPKLGLKTKKDIDAFWDEVGKLKRQRDADEVLTYLTHILDRARAAKVSLTRDMLIESGAGIKLFNGVTDWFDRVDAFAKSIGLELEHYVVSAGNQEIIEGCAIHNRFKRVFACNYCYGEDGAALWPAVSVNYTTKTQFLFRINKGIENYWDKEAVNRWMPQEDRPVPFSRMIFIGDGDTDIPSFKMMTEHGGWPIAVFDPREWNDEKHRAKTHGLIAEGRVNFVAPADYADKTQLDVLVRGILGRIAREARVHPEFFKNGKFAKHYE